MKENNKSVTNEIQLVVFDLASEHYGIDISAVSEIIRMQTITKVPGTYNYIEGVINLRGEVITILDIRKRLGLTINNSTKDTRIIIIEINMEKVGIIVDAVLAVLRIPTSSIEPPTSIITSTNLDYILGIAKLNDKLITIIDPHKPLETSKDEMTGFEVNTNLRKSDESTNIKRNINSRHTKEPVISKQ